ncbi:MAG TPA: hypothetical protein VE994_23155 [Terriglobales bacterium]|nr:hypothetical protein [Terriglobales bacterium]
MRPRILDGLDQLRLDGTAVLCLISLEHVPADLRQRIGIARDLSSALCIPQPVQVSSFRRNSSQDQATTMGHVVANVFLGLKGRECQDLTLGQAGVVSLVA